MRLIGEAFMWLGMLVVCVGMSLAGCQKLVIIQSGEDTKVDSQQEIDLETDLFKEAPEKRPLKKPIP